MRKPGVRRLKAGPGGNRMLLLVLLMAGVVAAGAGVGSVVVEQDGVPQRMNLQGFLTDADGNSIEGERAMQFLVYAGTSVQWQEARVCTARAGLFSVLLGEVAPIPDSVFAPGVARELELVVEGQTLAPRVALTSTGFAYRAVMADRADAVARPLSPPAVSSEIGDGAVTMSKISGYGASAGYVVKWNGHEWQPLPDEGGSPSGPAGGDLAGTYPNPQVAGLRGRALATTTPSTGDVLHWYSSQWRPAALGGDLSGRIDAATVTALQGRSVYNTSPSTGQILTWYSSRWEPRSMGGDVSGYAYDLTVTGLRGRTVSTTSPSTGQVLTWYNSQWTPRTPGFDRDCGSVRLSRGRVRVELGPEYAGKRAGDYYVFAQQTDGQPVPVVVKKHEGWFEIAAGTETEAVFDYRVIAGGD